MQIELHDRECSLLLELLETYYGELRAEIRRTDNPMYKRELKGREEIVEGLLARLRAAGQAAA
jgi:hypothetical protein